MEEIKIWNQMAELSQEWASDFSIFPRYAILLLHIVYVCLT